MDDLDSKVTEILRKGFVPLQPGESAMAEAVENVIYEAGRKKIKKSATSNVVNFAAGWKYGLAALLAISVIGGVYILYLFSGSMRARFSVQPERCRLRCELLSAVTDSGPATFHPKIPDRHCITDERSQMLYAVGERTRAVLFQRSGIRVDRADSGCTSISLLKGSIAVEVIPGGSDTVIIVTPNGSFTQIGTRFSVSVDTIQGSRIEVYRGSVLVRPCNGSDTVLIPGQTWESRGGNVGKISLTREEIDALDGVFVRNRLDSLLRGGSDRISGSTGKNENRIRRRSHGRKLTLSPAVDSAMDLTKLIAQAAEREDYHSLDSLLDHPRMPLFADTVAASLLTIAERKERLFRYSASRTLCEKISEREIYSGRRREAASMRAYMLHKRHIETSAVELLRMAEEHYRRFSSGPFADGMVAERIELLLRMRRYHDAIAVMELLIDRFPESAHHEYVSYLYASTLRDNLHREAESFAAYEKYSTRYPDGKYGEDALYHIVRIGTVLGVDVARYRRAYLRRYPRGRWIDGIRSGKTVAGSIPNKEREATAGDSQLE